MLIQSNPKTQENRVRRKAAREGYRLHKSRQRAHVPNINNHGEFMVVENSRNIAVLGWDYDATLDDIEAFLDEPAE